MFDCGHDFTQPNIRIIPWKHYIVRYQACPTCNVRVGKFEYLRNLQTDEPIPKQILLNRQARLLK